MCVFFLKSHCQTDQPVLSESHLGAVIPPNQAKVSDNRVLRVLHAEWRLVNVPVQPGHPGFAGTSHRFCQPE